MPKLQRTDSRHRITACFVLVLLTSLSSVARGQQVSAPAAQSESILSVQEDAIPESTIEHWDVLSLSGNTFHEKQPLFGEKDTFPDFTRELIRLQWRAADPIDLYIIRPAHVTKPPVVLFLYSYPSETDRFRDDAFCRALIKRGFVAIGFVSALTGHRYHDRPMKEWFISELQESLSSSVHDVQLILNYLATRDDLDLNRVGMFGQGSGGTIAILSATVEPRIKVLDILDPWGDWPDWIATSPQIPERERAAYLEPEFLTKIAPLDPVKWLPQLKDRPMRIQQTLFSPIASAEVRKAILKAVPTTAKSVQLKDLDEYREKVAKDGKLLDWLQEQLHSVDPPNERTLDEK